MNGRERVIRTLRRERPDRLPIADALWEDTLARWQKEGMPSRVTPADYFGYDIDHMAIDASPRLEQRVLSQDDEFIVYRDRYGYTVKKTIGKSRTMHFLDHVTKDRAAWETLKPRYILDPHDRSRIDEASYFMHLDEYPSWEEARQMYEAIRRRGRYLLFNAYGPYEATWRHRGFDRFLLDLAEDADFAFEMAETYTNLLLDVLRHCLELGIRPDGFFMVEDLAYTAGMLMSPRTWRRVFKPHTMRLGCFLHDHGIAFWMHCCGNAEAVFDDLIECGLQVIQPLEAKSGLDVRQLRKRYGRNLTFWGNIDVINMAGGSDAEVKEEIRTKLTPFKQDGGGYIYHSDHSVPPEVSLERYRYVLELLHRYGRIDGD